MKIAAATTFVTATLLGRERILAYAHHREGAVRTQFARGVISQLGSDSHTVAIGRAAGMDTAQVREAIGDMSALATGATSTIPDHILAAISERPILSVQLEDDAADTPNLNADSGAESRTAPSGLAAMFGPPAPSVFEDLLGVRERVQPEPHRDSAGSSFTAIDFELANPKRYSPCSIGLAKVRDGQVIDSVSQLIRPPDAAAWFHPRSVAVHGIRAPQVRSAPRFEQLLDALIAYVDGDVLVGHSVAVEKSVITQTCGVLRLPVPDFTYRCTLLLAKRHLQMPHHRLPDVMTHLGLPDFDHHDACADAVASAQIMLELADRGLVAPIIGGRADWAPHALVAA